MRSFALCATAVILFVTCSSNLSVAEDKTDAAKQASEILTATGIQGGLVVHVGCGDGKLTAALRANNRYRVHGLDRDTDNVKTARENVRKANKYGPVFVETWHGKYLPYTNNLVNLIVDEDPAELDREEVLRVLAPGGVAYVKQDDKWNKITKPWPKEIDEWTHFMHSPSNNAVANDTVVGPPHHLQWVGGPKWARGHEVLATISAVVSAQGRIFYIADEGPIASVDLPSKWMLVARDAFNGMLLWKSEIARWESRHRPFRSGPPQLPRRLVAVGDTVYVTPGYLKPVVALNAATGEEIRTYKDTEGTEEILCHEGVLYLAVGDIVGQQAADKAARRGHTVPRRDTHIMAVDAKTGETLWKHESKDAAKLLAQTLAVSGGRVFYQSTSRVVCLDAKSGEQQWTAERLSALNRPAWSVPTLVVHGDIVISADRRAPEPSKETADPKHVDWTVSFKGGGSSGKMVAFSAKDGKPLWSAPAKEGYNAPVDVLLTDGLLWSGKLVKAREPGITEALDPATGKVARKRPSDLDFFSPGMSHHRCYRNRATSNYILLGRSGIELVDIKTGKATANHWVRGTCQFGVLPANGMIYSPPHTCACYLKTKLNGFNALAPKRTTRAEDGVEVEPRLLKGPAYEKLASSKPKATQADDWPTYRGNVGRSGSTTAKVPAQLKQAWTADLGGELSSIVSADGRVFVCREDQHTVHALDAETGQEQWNFTTGGAVDSPPTVYGDAVLFGSADGHVYCVRATDGRLAWRFRAGPEDRRMVIESRLESAWPVHGSLLIQNDVAYFSAGRSSYLDGGIYLYGLNPLTGEVVAEAIESGRDPKTGEQPRSAVKGFDMKSGLPDVLSSDGEFVYMRDVKFDKKLKKQAAGGAHLFSPTGFLDDSWWHRSYWLYGASFRSGWGGWDRAGMANPSGRIVVYDDAKVYGFGLNKLPGRNVGQWNSGEYYRLFSIEKKAAPTAKDQAARRRGKKKPAPKRAFDWEKRIEPEVRAMVLTGDTLFVAGPHGEPHKVLSDFLGNNGISLRALSAKSGDELASYNLKSMPVFDGMAAARGKLFMATKDGKVLCFGGE